jgi:hypothetical protein
MKAASIAEIKKELLRLEHGELLEACLRLARFKKDNKELLTYLLFLSDNESAFVSSVCQEIDEQFSLTPNAHKKTIRKVIRWMNKLMRFTKVKDSEVQVRLHFCRVLRASKTPIRSSKVVTNMYNGQLKKVRKVIEKFHPEIQREIEREVLKLEL